MTSVWGADFRRIDHRQHLGQAALVMVAARSYDAPRDEVWDAITSPARLERWFGYVDGDFEPEGRYHIQGNASGTINRCDPPRALSLTWEFDGGTSWVELRLDGEGQQACLTLEHIAHRGGPGEAHLQQYGPGAVGVGWDLSLHGLALHLSAPDAQIDPSEAATWLVSDGGKAFVRGSGLAWAEAHRAAGADPVEARAQAERTIAFYTGG